MIKRIDGIEYEYIKARKDSKLNLLFIHGTGCNKTFLKALAELFSDYNCYLIDLPGHGNSRNTGYNFDNYIKAITSLVNKLHNVVLVGHSLGGTLAIKELSLGLKQVIGGVLLNSSAHWTDLDKDFINNVRKGVVDLEWLVNAAGHMDNKDVTEALQNMEPSGHTMADFFIDETINVEDCMRKIKVPALIIGGEDEVLALPKYQEDLHKNIKNSKLIMIPGGKHMSCLAEKNKVKDYICDFINQDILKKENVPV